MQMHYQEYPTKIMDKEKSKIIYHRTKDGKLLKIPNKNEKDSILWMYHNHPTAAHFGVETTYNKIKEKFFWRGMYNDIRKYIKYCDICQRRGKKGESGKLYPIKVGEPFERIGIDFIGPLTPTKRGNKYILVATDYLTKWPEAKPMKEANANNVVEFIYKEIICRHGCPKIILSDRGSHFNNQMVQQLCQKFEIKHCEMLAQVSYVNHVKGVSS